MRKAVLLIVLAAPFALHAAEEGGEAEAPKVVCKRSLNLGATFKSGNTEKALYTANLTGERKSDEMELINSIYAEYGETEVGTLKEQSEGQVRAQSEWRKRFSKKFFYGLNAEAYHDAIKEIRYRIKLGPNMGYYFLETEKQQLDASAGVNYVFEKTATGEDDFAEYRAALNYNWDFSETSSYYFSLQMTAKVEDVDDHTGLVVTGVKSKMNEALSLMVELRDEYESKPDVATLEKNDVTLFAGVNYDF